MWFYDVYLARRKLNVFLLLNCYRVLKLINASLFFTSKYWYSYIAEIDQFFRNFWYFMIFFLLFLQMTVSCPPYHPISFPLVGHKNPLVPVVRFYDGLLWSEIPVKRPFLMTARRVPYRCWTYVRWTYNCSIMGPSILFKFADGTGVAE